MSERRVLTLYPYLLNGTCSAGPALDAAERYWQITAQLRELEGKNDPESRSLFADLLDELMCVDWSVQPARQAMARAAKPTLPPAASSPTPPAS